MTEEISEEAKAKAYVEEVCNKSDGKATTGHADLEGKPVNELRKAAEAAKKEMPKAPSIRGNLKLIKELTKGITGSDIVTTRAISELSQRINLVQEEFQRFNDRVDNLFPAGEANENTVNAATGAQRISNLEQCIAKMAHYTGGNNPRICKEFGIKNYEVKLKDMSKFAIT